MNQIIRKMKKAISILITTIIMLCFAESVFAAKSSTSTLRTTFKCDIHSNNCAKKIVSTLNSQKGVKSVGVDIKEKIVMVEYSPSKQSKESIVKHLEKIKVSAKPVQTTTAAIKVKSPSKR